jgi:hypothetical protein
VRESYIRENIAETVISIIIEIVSSNRLGFFIADNAAKNNTIIRAIITYLYPNIKNPNSKRIRYLDYIINLIVKAFLFGNDADAFKKES